MLKNRSIGAFTALIIAVFVSLTALATPSFAGEMDAGFDHVHFDVVTTIDTTPCDVEGSTALGLARHVDRLHIVIASISTHPIELFANGFTARNSYFADGVDKVPWRSNKRNA